MKRLSFDATISALDAETSALDVETSAFVAATAAIDRAEVIRYDDIGARCGDVVARCGDVAIARSYWRYRRGVSGNIGDCGVGITPQMSNRVTNHGDVSTFSDSPLGTCQSPSRLYI